MKDGFLAVLTRPILVNNPVAVQLLGICSALAVTKSVSTGLAMSGALAAVLVLSNALISVLRRVIPHSTRLVLQMIIISTLVIVTDQVLAAFAPEMSARLSIFVSLIITNCIVLGRAEGFAMTHGVVDSVADGIGNALGYALLLTTVGAVRELLGEGSLLDVNMLALKSDGGWFTPLKVMQLPPAGFFLIALFVWLTTRMRTAPAARSADDVTKTKGGAS